MNRVVALICTAGLLGTAYCVYPLAAQDDNPDATETPKKKETFKETPNDSLEKPTLSDEGPRFSNRPGKDKPEKAGAGGRYFDDDVDYRPRAGVPGALGEGMGMRMGRRHDRDVMFRRRVITRHFQEEISEPVPPEEQEEHKQFHDAIRQLKEAKDDANKKDEISKTIRELLNKQFERDLAHRESELVAVEERVKTLRKQLDKRKSAKDEIISLRVKTIINDVDGLGFPGEEGFRDGPTVRGLPDTVHFEHQTFERDPHGSAQDSEGTQRGGRPGAFPRPRPSPVR